MIVPTIHKAQKILRHRLDSYEDERDLWKEDHGEASRYFDFRDFISGGIELYKELCHLEEAWRTDVYRKLIPYDARFLAKIEGLFSTFSDLAFDIEQSLLLKFEADQGIAEIAAEFRRYCQELRDAMTPDTKFFVDEKLADLRDEALEQNARGDCEQWSS